MPGAQDTAFMDDTVILSRYERQTCDPSQKSPGSSWKSSPTRGSASREARREPCSEKAGNMRAACGATKGIATDVTDGCTGGDGQCRGSSRQ